MFSKVISKYNTVVYPFLLMSMRSHLSIGQNIIKIYDLVKIYKRLKKIDL